MAATLTVNSFWADKSLYDDAEKRYYENQAKLRVEDTCKVKNKKSKNKSRKDVVIQNEIPLTVQVSEKEYKKKNGKSIHKKVEASVGVPRYKYPKAGGGDSQLKSSLASEVAKARQHIKASLESVSNLAVKPAPVADKSCSSGKCGAPVLAEALAAVQDMIKALEKRVAALEVKCSSCPPAQNGAAKAAPAKPAPSKKEEDDDVDLFGSESEEEDAEALKIKEQRLAEYAAKKSTKTAIIAKSSLVLDVKPWGDDTDMKALEEGVRAIQMDGLLWGASKLAPLAYGIHKLQITCVVEDDKVSVDLLTENIEELTDLVQSVDIAAFNKI